MFQKIFLLKEAPLKKQLRDLTVREWAFLCPLILLSFAMGLVPNGFLNTQQPL